MQNFRYFLLWVICSSFIQCQTQKTTHMYLYTDQNNNTYTINASEVIYNPIKPIESSSGMYSGGVITKVTITEEEFNKFASLAEELFMIKEFHNLKREMMTSVLSSKKNKESRNVILKRSEKRSSFEAMLQKIVKK